MLMLDYNFFSSFESEIGFRYNLEALCNAQETNCIFMVLASVCPPGTPYSNQSKTLQAAFPFIKMKWDSKEDQITFEEDDIMLNGLPLHHSSVIIFDIKRFNMRTKILDDFGFAIQPVV